MLKRGLKISGNQRHCVCDQKSQKKCKKLKSKQESGNKITVLLGNNFTKEKQLCRFVQTWMISALYSGSQLNRTQFQYSPQSLA